MEFFSDLFYFLLELSKSLNFLNLGLIVFCFSLLFSAFSISLKTAIFGYPKLSVALLILHIILPLILYGLSVIDCLYGTNKMGSLSNCFLYLFILISAITGLYATFFALAERNLKKISANDITVTLDKLVAKIEEVNGDNLIKLKTEKLGAKKPRVDDNINYYRLQEYIYKIKSKDLSPIERSTLKTCENTILHYKNTFMTEKMRRDLCDCFLSIIKLHAKYCCVKK